MSVEGPLHARPTSRREVLLGLGALASSAAFPVLAQTERPQVDATFLFISDVHACRMASGLSPNCQQEGKTDENLLRHVRALNSLPGKPWPEGVGLAGRSIAIPLGIVVGGDMTDDGGGQTATPGEGTQLMQFSERYSQGTGPDRVHFPVYVGLGNHDLDQDGPVPHADWYRRELRDYVEMNHRNGVFFKPPVPVANYDVDTDCYSWDWGGLHLVQMQRFGGDTTKGAPDSLPWLKADLAANASDGRPVVLFQHYGWDPFSTEVWDAAKSTFDDVGDGPAHWWSAAQREAFEDAVGKANVVAIFHGHQHETPMIYRAGRFDVVKPKAAFMGGFALVRIADGQLTVALGEVTDDNGSIDFTQTMEKPIG